MRYLPKSAAEREQMLAEIGAASIDDLFAVIPGEYRLGRDLDVPRQQAESEIIDYFALPGIRMRLATRAFWARALIVTIGRSLSTLWSSAVSFLPVTRPIKRR